MGRIFIFSWAINSLTLYILARLFSGGISISNLVPIGGGLITREGLISVLIGGLIIGLLNAVVKPILQVLSLPLTCLTLGLFSFVVTGFVFYLSSLLTPGMHIKSFLWAIIGALLFGIINSIIHAILGVDEKRKIAE